MTFIELFLIAVGLSMDAFAIAICAGLTMPKATVKNAMTVGLYFGVSQAVMPVIGYLLAGLFAEAVTDYGHWVAFCLLCFIGGRMAGGSFKKEDDAKREVTLSPGTMLPLAIATSIDAMAVGVSFAFLRVNIVLAAAFIGVTTLVISMVGVKIGNAFGARFKSKAELAGGLILILIGIKILVENLAMA